MKLIIDCLIYESKKAPGYEQYLHNLLNYFHLHRQELLFDEIILAVRENQIHDFVKYSPIFTVKGFKVKSIVSQLFIQNILKHKLKLKKDDVILFTYGYSSVYKQCKSVLVVHDLLHLHYPQYFIMAKRLQRAIFVPLSLRISDKVIAISSFTKNDILKYFRINPYKVEVIYNDCNFAKFHKESEESTKEVERLKRFISGEANYFLSVSSLSPHKNVILLIKAFIELAKVFRNYNLVFVGNSSKLDSDSREMISKARIENRIFFTGYISNYTLGRLYEHCRAFVLPTKFEGFGLPIAEALYFNVPVIVSNIDICREIAGKCAFYINHEDVNSLIDAMKTIIESRFEKKDTRSIVIEKYSPKSTSGKYIELLNRIASSNVKIF